MNRFKEIIICGCKNKHIKKNYFDDNYSNNEFFSNDGAFRHDRICDIIRVDSVEKFKRAVSFLEIYNNILYFFYDNSNNPLTLNELENKGIIKKESNKYIYTFNTKDYYKKYWEELLNKEIKNYTVYGYESHLDVCLREKYYYSNELFKNGCFDFNNQRLDKIKSNINSMKELINTIDVLLRWKWDTFYIFKDNSKMPLTIKELEELGIIRKVDDYIKAKEWNLDTHDLMWYV